MQNTRKRSLCWAGAVARGTARLAHDQGLLNHQYSLKSLEPPQGAQLGLRMISCLYHQYSLKSPSILYADIEGPDLGIRFPHNRVINLRCTTVLVLSSWLVKLHNNMRWDVCLFG